MDIDHRSSSIPVSPSSSSPSDSNPPQDSKTEELYQSIVKGRKSWRSMRRGEVVWPPELEAALIEGLEKYNPVYSRETRLLGRFPGRNRFISDYIYSKTGKIRTVKQVGNRLQQLRDTAGGQQLLKALTPSHPRNRPSRPQAKDPHAGASDSASNSGVQALVDSDASALAHGDGLTTITEARVTSQSSLYGGVEDPHRDFELHNISDPGLFHAQSQPPHEAEHKEYYVAGGDLQLVAGGKLFRTHSHFFSRESPYWKDILAGKASSSDVHKRVGSHETITFDVDEDPADVADFLWVFYTPEYGTHNTSLCRWATIFKLATKWGFPDVLHLAISHTNEILWESDIA